MSTIDIPIVVGPGSQPPEVDGLEVDYKMPDDDMSVYTLPQVPEPDEIEGLDQAIDLLRRLQAALAEHQLSQSAVVFPLDALDSANLELVNQLLGSGEVSMTFRGEVDVQIQESVLAGVWRVQSLGTKGEVVRDVIEIAAIPSLVTAETFKNNVSDGLDIAALDIPENVYNAPPLLAEIADKMPRYRSGDEAHVINLSLLPHTDEDIDFLVSTLGVGPTVILSRGYGNCRISSTATRHVWWVQYFNSQDSLILNTLEISEVPDVACAAQEDIDDSAQRLLEILDIYRGR